MRRIKGPARPERGGCDPTWKDIPEKMPDENPLPVPQEEPIAVPDWPQPAKKPAEVA